MARNYKKGVYTFAEIGEIIHKKCPGRYKDATVASRMATRKAKELGIGDINGKKKFMLIPKTEAERIISAVVNGRTKRRRTAEQISLGEFLDDDQIIDWLEPYTPHSKKKDYVPPIIEPTEEEPLTKEELEHRVLYLIDELKGVLDAYLNINKEE